MVKSERKLYLTNFYLFFNYSGFYKINVRYIQFNTLGLEFIPVLLLLV